MAAALCPPSAVERRIVTELPWGWDGAAMRRGRASLVTVTLILVSSPAAFAAQDWLAVEAWTGSFRIEHIRSLDEKQLFGFSSTGQIRNTASGTVTFDRKVDPETWAGSGTAVWSVDEHDKVCSELPMPCREKTVKGNGEVALGEGTELEISAYGNTYDLWIYPGGEHLEGIEVESREIPLGGVHFEDDAKAGMPRPTTKPIGGRGAFYDASLYAGGLFGYLEEDVRLPEDGYLLCGSQERDDGTVVSWKLWPAGTEEPPCAEFDELEESP